MSGIFGLFNTNSEPIAEGDLARMAAPLERRGPEGTGIWYDALAGLGHTLLATTPEAVHERLPLRDHASGCVITADVRLDNRPELLSALGIRDRTADIGDAEIVLRAYLAWGESCLQRLLGDFAFAIWDPRRRALFCARDHFGLRPFYYHHTLRRFFAFASEPRAILTLPQTPYRINEGRIADFLVNELEGIDKTSTFFEEVYRLPPAHSLTVTPNGLTKRRYWTLEPGPELRLPSDEAYAEAFLEVFTGAVRCRLRSAGPVGSMLSGGMDSGSVVAVARGLLAEQGRGPLLTFSAVGPDPETCVETRAIHAAMTMDGIAPHAISFTELDALMPELEELTWNLEEPFDNHMTLPRAVYLMARRAGVKVVLDGVGGDIVLAEGTYLARLLRRGRWWKAWREAVLQNRFWGGNYPAWQGLYHSARTAFVPNSVRRLAAKYRARRRVEQRVRESLIHPGFAESVQLSERLATLDSQGSPGFLCDYARERAEGVLHPYQTVGRERYDRVASALALEPRDPFRDRRVVDLCLRLPGAQKLDGGWPKAVLRRATTHRLPDAVRWRQGKEHLGWRFTVALMGGGAERLCATLVGSLDILKGYVDLGALRKDCDGYLQGNTEADAEQMYTAASLSHWLSRHRGRRGFDVEASNDGIRTGC
jgi:asparagine synthase (glutamine-hydrolysing)